MAGFTFGSTPTATNANTSFGLSTTPSLSFGGGTTTATPGGLTFGAPNTSATALGGGLGSSAGHPQTGGFSFGSIAAPAATTTGLSFGTGTSGGGLNFKGATTTAPGTGLGFSFGTTSQPQQPPQQQQQQPNFSAPTPGAAATSATGGLSFFSTPSSTPQTTISFGATPQQTGGLFPAPQTSQTTLTFNAPSSTSSTAAKPSLGTLSFGAPSIATTTSAVTTSTSLNFGFPSVVKTTSTTGFSLSTPSTGATGIFGFPSATTTTASTATTSSAPVFKGLGGVDTTQSLTNIGGANGGIGGRSENKTAKENAVPNDILFSIEHFKGFVKSQKNLSCEVARASVKPMAKVTEDTQALQQMLSSLAADVQKNNFLAERLKAETSKGFAQCEMAQRTHDTPAGLQNDNTLPLEFFMNLAAKFEHNVHVLRQEIDNTEKHVNTLNQPTALTPQELSLALKRLHESFVALAGRLQVVHQTVIAQKQRHLSLRRHFLKDTSDIFSKPDSDSSKKSGMAAGPTPFSAMGTVQTLGIMVNQDKSISSFPVGGPSMSSWRSQQTATPVPSIGSGGSLFGSSTPFSTTTDNSNFQLLKPPPGNKRGKR